MDTRTLERRADGLSTRTDFGAVLTAPPSEARSLSRTFHEVLQAGEAASAGYEAGFDGESFAWRCDDAMGQGGLEYVKLSRGVWLVFGDLQLNTAQFCWHREERALNFSMLLRGAAMLGTPLGAHRRVLYTEGCAVATACSGDTLICRHSLQGVRCQGVSVLFDDDEAVREFGLDPVEVRRWIESATPGAHRGDRSPRIAVSNSNLPAIRAAQAILWTPFSGARRRLYLRSKVGELMCHLLTGPVMEPADLACIDGGLQQDNLAAVAHAALSDPDDCPEIADLAARLDVSTGRLVSAFKARYGISPREHAIATRMARARRLLQQTRTSLLDVALSCGYEHHSSFSTAYRRTFGETPLETRRAADGA
ncbi:helix-turn-helix transcriptional regulator [Mitsuaria sp. GD03876]|uniref:helix-turn-helix transcriptional regulator n=1 Tax=Mitsuaria sp. GD03876 TaxID=2975399 RepID=UPI00244D34E0|nr:helix-turn-helix transcriptional regulator [Mitsuaria sp. GD03876]